jgi:CO/xanthine dehydrogenase FAD-binding subunit
MDLITVEHVRQPRTRDEMRLAAGEVPLGGGTWLYSEPQTATTLVDLTTLGWQPLTETDAGLEIAATCTIETLAAHTPLFDLFAESLLASWKIQHVATVGGNVCLALPAGSMTSLAVALDGVAVVWGPDTERRELVETFVTGVRTTTLAAGEVLRAIELPRAALAARHGFRRIALSPLGRTGTLVTGRVGDDGVQFAVTGGVPHPRVFRFDEMPTADAVSAAIDGITDWYFDAHGTPDWRRAQSLRFALELREELS